MSAEVRTAIATAVSAVEGITCSEYFRQSTKAGDAMVRFDRANRASNGFGYMHTWQVLVLLPQDIATAEKYLEEKLPALIEACEQEMVVTTVTPQELILTNGVTVPCVVIEGSR